MRIYDAIVVGSGFAGSLLARILSRGGWDVLLVEKGRHPRFALGESTTPLANLALERISERFELPDLFRLATYGRWLESFPEVRRGLKRGFSFYSHRAGRDYDAGSGNARRLLVAASPEDRLADTHWLREDVDHLFARAAVESGVTLSEETRLDSVEFETDRAVLSGQRAGGRADFEGRVILDASGAGGFLARTLPLARGSHLRTCSSLLYGHFEGVESLAELAGLATGEAPYPEDRAAVHHLLDEGWLYSLRFDDGLVSAGLLVEDPAEVRAADPAAEFTRLVGRYPSLAACFAEAHPVRPVASRPSIQYRLAATHGPRWSVLPNTYGFIDPLFSTGIAWSLLGVERLAELLLERSPEDPEIASGAAFARYGELLELELAQADRLISAAYRARSHFDLFAAHSLLYFATVSFEEAAQRFGSLDSPCWRGFLGASDPDRVALFDEASRRIDDDSREPGEFETWVVESISPFDVAGFDSPAHRNLYPADFEILVERAPRLGLSPQAVRAALPLRS